MIRKTISYLSLGLIVIVGIYIIWWNLPFTINRYSDIQKGEQIISNFNNSNSSSNQILKNLTLEDYYKLGFDTANGFEIPQYFIVNDSTFELIYVEGFDGPYLIWNSNEKKWKIGNPTYPDDWQKK